MTDKVQLSLEEKYALICTGEYGVFEMYDNYGEVTAFRGFRKGYGTTDEVDTYKDALELALETFAHE